MSNRTQVVPISSLLSDFPRNKSYSVPTSPSKIDQRQSNPVSKPSVPIDALIDKDSLANVEKDKLDNSSFGVVPAKQKRSGWQPTSPQQMASTLRMRLQYAKLKLENGWESQSLARLESRNNFLASQTSTNYFYSVPTSTAKVRKCPSAFLSTSPVLKSKQLTKNVRKKSHGRTISEPSIDPLTNVSPSLLNKGPGVQSLIPVSIVPVLSSNLLRSTEFSDFMNTGQNPAFPPINTFDNNLNDSLPGPNNYKLPSFAPLNSNMPPKSLSLINEVGSPTAGQMEINAQPVVNSFSKSPTFNILLNHDPAPPQSKIQDLLN
jgi:hypothetical protein